MSQPDGKCPNCDRVGAIGERCPEKACKKRGYHCIPQVFWDRAHRDGDNPDPMIGTVAGDFLIVDRIGAGGFGKVYLALQSPLFRLRGALKLIDFPSDNAIVVQALSEKFQGEAEALADLTHPNIVRLLKYGMHGKKPYLVMEYVKDAATLRHEISVRAKRQTGFTHDQLKDVFDQILNGLEAAHAQNIIHRDVKPENVMLQEVVGNPMHVKILDFGTAKFVENRADTKWPLGSPSYMAPEQVNLKGIGPWSDLYAVGVMIYELLTGHRPFPGKTENEIVSYKMDETFDPFGPVEKLGFPNEVMSFLRKALERNHEDRYRSVEEFRGSMHIAFGALTERPGTFGSDGAELTDLLDSSDLIQAAMAVAESPTKQATRPPAGIIATDEKSEPPELPAPLSAGPEQNPKPTPEPEPAEDSSTTASSNKSPMMAAVAVLGLLAVVTAFFAFQSGDSPTPEENPKPPQTNQAVVADAGPDLTTMEFAADAGTIFDAGMQADASDAAADVQMRITSVSAAKFHTCAIIDGNIRCWGANFEGELGIGNNERYGDNEPASAAPFVDLGKKAIQVAAAGDRQSNFTCALLEDGEVRCWGENQFGQLGLGNTSRVGQDNLPKDAPPVDLGLPAKYISAGASSFASHVCAILASGSLRCWGGNKYGELGLAHTTIVGDNESPSAVPPVTLQSPAIHVSSGKYHTCVVTGDGAVRCWGWNKYGQLGLGHTDNIGDDEMPNLSEPVKLGGKAESVAVGRWHSCALMRDGEVKCWGRNNIGQLGYGNTVDIGDNESPKNAVSLGGKATHIALGSLHTCAILEGGRVKCWGDNKFGQLGYSHTRDVGEDESVTTVADVFLGEKAIAISSGAYHNCVILESDQLKCWGYNKFGQLGYGHTQNVGDTETPAAAGNVPVFSKETNE